MLSLIFQYLYFFRRVYLGQFKEQFQRAETHAAIVSVAAILK